MPDINDTIPICIEAGSTIELVESATTHTLKNLEAGTLEFTKPLRKAKEYTDRDAIQTPLESGVTIPGTVKMTVKLTKYEATNWWNLIHTAGAAGLVKLFTTLTIKVPDYFGHTAGTQFIFTDLWLNREDPPTVKAGQDFDTVTCAFKYKTGGDSASY
jgi:hypothetical protein